MRNDCNLMKRINVFEIVVEKSVACFVICCSPLLVFCHEDALLCHSKENLVSSLFEVSHVHDGLIASGGKESSFVYKVSQVSTACSWSSPCNPGQVHILAQLHLSCVYLQDIQPFLDIRKGHSHLSVESAWSQKSWIQNVRTVGCSDYDYSRICGESIHLNQHLVQCLLPFVVTST